VPSKVSETIIGYRKQEKYLLHEFVIMPKHRRLLLTPAAGASIERSMPFIKGGYSYRAGKELGSSGEIWQRGHVHHRIRNAQDYFIHGQYIRLNPVQAHLLDAAEEYLFSSAHSSFDLGAIASGAKPFSRSAVPGPTKVGPSRYTSECLW